MITEKIVFAASQLRSQALAYGADAIEAARKSALRAADRVVATRQPVRTLADAGLRFSALSGRYFERMLGKNVEVAETVIEDGARSLKLAAKAQDLRSLIRDQRELAGSSRQRLGRELRDAWGITTESGRELKQLAVKTYAEVVHGQKVAKSQPRKAARKRASVKTKARTVITTAR